MLLPGLSLQRPSPTAPGPSLQLESGLLLPPPPSTGHSSFLAQLTFRLGDSGGSWGMPPRAVSWKHEGMRAVGVTPLTSPGVPFENGVLALDS